MMEETKTSRARVAFVLLCGLAICCSVMYVTSDGEESVHEDNGLLIGAGIDRHAPRSIESQDVKKAGMIITQTPRALRKKQNGNERLYDYFKYIEGAIAKEVAGRKADITAIRATMAKNMELNEAARNKMKKALLKQMAINAKKAKDDLDLCMRKTQAEFAKTAEFENKRYTKNLQRSAETRKIMRENKALAQKNLQTAVLAQQRSLAALAQATSAKIHATKMKIHSNAEQIVANAKKAKEELDHAMNNFDKKMANVKEQARKGRSKLAVQAAQQDAKFREDANNKIKGIVAQNAAKFAKVRAQMAKDRAAADKALADNSKRMDAALKAQQALNNKRFAKTVEDIAAAKKEAAKRVHDFAVSYKASIVQLTGVAEAQNKMLNKRMDDLSKTVSNNKLSQAKVNDDVNKELKAMQHEGQKRYDEGLKKDRDLEKIMEKNAEDVAKKMSIMKNNFVNGLDHIKAQMAKDRKHAETALAKNTQGLYATMKANIEAQDEINKKIDANTKKAKKEAAENLKIAKDQWIRGMAKMHKTVNDMEAKHDGQIKKLTGIVEANAIKDAKGRAELQKIQKFNKEQVQGALTDAIKKGEQRALQIEKNQKAATNKMRTELNTRITTEISQLKGKINKQLLALRYNTPASRKFMKRETDMAIEVATHKAKEHLKKTVAAAEQGISALNSHFKGKKLDAAAEAKIASEKKNILAKVLDAVSGQEKALLAFKTENIATNGFVPKHKKKPTLTGAADKMIADAKAVESEMAADIKAIVAKLTAAKKKAVAELQAVSEAAAKRYASVVDEVTKSLFESLKTADKVYSKVYIAMAEDRKKLDEDLSSAVSNLNDNIAKYAALQNTAFSKSVHDIGKARKAASVDVLNSRKVMTSLLYATVSKVKEVETRLQGEVSVVSGFIMSAAAASARVAAAVQKEMKVIMADANRRTSDSTRAKGVLKSLMDENKVAAAQEVKGIFNAAMTHIIEVRSAQHTYLGDFAEGLTHSTAHYYGNDDSKSAEAAFATSLTSTSNAITANQKHVQHLLQHMTGVTFNFQHTTPTDRKCIAILTGAMKSDMNKAIVKAIQYGEVKAKHEIENEGKKVLLTTVSSKIENMADSVFEGVEPGRDKIADNYLSLKAYSMAASDAIEDYLAKGKGRYLSSIGDLLKSIGQLGNVETLPAPGMGFGASTMPLLFSGKEVPVDGKSTKINGLVNEYMSVLAQVKQRWPMGLGSYLIAKLESAMEKTGALEVDKVPEKAGNFVFVNGHAVGLSSKLSDFESLAVHMSDYEHVLMKLSGNLAKALPGHSGVKVFVKPPEWQGN